MANILGLEIAPDAVRAALIKTALRKTQIARFVEVPVGGPGAGDALGVHPDDTEEPGAYEARVVQAAVREALRQAGAAGSSIVAALPGEEASIRRVELPAVVAKKLDELLPLEMEALVPFDAEQTFLEHQPIETADGKLRVLVVAVPRDRIRGHLEHLAGLGADPQVLAVGAAALDGLPAVVPALAAEGPFLVVHLGLRRADVVVMRRGQIELARTVSAGIADIADGGFSAAAGSTAERLSRDLRQTVASWRMQGGAAPLAVHVSGLGLEDPRTLGWFAEATGLPSEPVAVPDATPSSGADAPTRARMAMALSLAARATGRARHIDLRRGEFAPRRTTGLVRQHAGLFAACALALVGSFLYSTYARFSVLDARRERLEVELSRVSLARLGEATRSPTRARTLLEGGGTRSDPLPRFSAYDALAAISGAIPEGISHDVQRLHIDLGDDRSGGHFELSGVVGTIEERDRIAQALGQVTCFRELDLGPLTQAPNERRSYRIEADIQCPEDAVAEAGGRSRSGRSGRSRQAGQGGSR